MIRIPEAFELALFKIVVVQPCLFTALVADVSCLSAESRKNRQMY